MLASAAALVGLAMASGCGQSVIVGLDDALGGSAGVAAGGSDSGGGGGTDSGGGGALSLAGANDPPLSGEAGAVACIRTACRGKFYECGDCVDNDGDGELDERDPACLGPCDDDELGLSTGLKMSGGAPCREDCYFDGDSGQGNDMCSWSQACDPLSVAPDYPPSGEMRCAYGGDDDCAAFMAQSQACRDNCLPLVPNGCDCFGCCEVPGRSGEYHFIGNGRGSLGCRLDALDDAASCPVCTPVESCFNPCDACEVCVGTEPSATCNNPAECERGTACGPTTACAAGEYCVTGCCVRVPR